MHDVTMIVQHIYRWDCKKSECSGVGKRCGIKRCFIPTLYWLLKASYGDWYMNFGEYVKCE